MTAALVLIGMALIATLAIVPLLLEHDAEVVSAAPRHTAPVISLPTLPADRMAGPKAA